VSRALQAARESHDSSDGFQIISVFKSGRTSK
jgi:hypothetical protein